jgi:polyhydroxybutyrate depolymerase
VELFKVWGGSHSWPGAVNVIYKTNQDFNASVEIWRFFRKYKLSQLKTTVGIRTFSEARTSMYPNPAQDFFFVPEAADRYKIRGLDSKILAEGNCDGKINVSALARGIYILELVTNGESFFTRLVKD